MPQNSEKHFKNLGKKWCNLLKCVWPFWHIKGESAEAALHRRSYKKVFWKYAANAQENTHAAVWLQ